MFLHRIKYVYLQHMLQNALKYRLIIAVLILIGWLLPVSLWADNLSRILVVTSYNPDTRAISSHLTSFMEEYAVMGGKSEVIVETINCKNLSELYEWKGRMREVLDKHTRIEKPEVVILLGQEAWASYLSMNEDWVRKLPVMGALISENTVTFPNDTVDLSEWKPVSINSAEYEDHNIVGGIAYEYNVAKNLDLVLRCFPKTSQIAFISDNTFGGIVMQAWVKKEMKKYPELDLLLLDGRVSSFMGVSEDIRNLPDNTCILMGTWRVDRTENYIIGNTTYMLHEANKDIPAFSLSSTGLGHWAIGGYIPQFHNLGHELAEMVFRYVDKDEKYKRNIQVVRGGYRFDVDKLNEFQLEKLDLVKGAELVNNPPNFYEQHKNLVITCLVAFLCLLIGLVGVTYYALRVRKLHANLKASQKQLMIARDKAEESNRLKSAFLANMSHEIRTPLNAIVGFSEVLVSDDHSKEDRLYYSEIIKKNSDSLLVLINDILDLSRIESGRIKMEIQETDIVGVLRDSLLTTRQSRKTEAEFKLEIPFESFKLATDGYRLKQVLINLLSNASKFTKAGTITLAVKRETDYLVFSVTDTGCGIPLDKAEKVFDRFEKLDEFAQGTGLGLSISRLIVEKLGGRIWVDTAYTKGARFIFTHPV